MKRIGLFCAVLILLVFGGCRAQGRTSGVPQQVKIAVPFWQIDAQALLTQRYLSEYLGPALNVQFMFSEAVSDAETLMNFIENAYAAGCHGIMNYQNSAVEQAIAKANELGMYIATNTTTMPVNRDLPYNLGLVAASDASVAKDFGDLVMPLISDEQRRNVIIVSAGAGLGNNEHRESTVAILNMLASVHNLRFERTVQDLAVSRSVTDAVNDRGIKITIYPGYPTGDTYVAGMSALLQTGEYDTVLACNAAYARFMVAIDEVERAFRKNIRVSAITTINDQTRTAFTTIDSTGNTSLDSAMLMPSISTAAGLFALVYNGITGHADAIRVNNEGAFYNSPKWKCPSAADYSRIERVNASNDTWEMNVDEVKRLLIQYNPGATYTGIFNTLNGMTIDSILRARGL